MPLPTRATVPVALPLRGVGELHQPGRLVGPQRHAEEPAEALVGDLHLVEDLDVEAALLGGPAGLIGELRSGSWPRPAR